MNLRPTEAIATASPFGNSTEAAPQASAIPKAARCAVIGAGWWGTSAHIPALKRHPFAELVAVHTENAENARRIARDFAVPASFTDSSELIKLNNIDGVIISSTPNAHYAQARAALERGIHVLIEKPMTLHASEAKELIDIATANRCHFVVSCPWHYTAHTLEARRLLRTGALGDIKMVGVLMTNFVMGLYAGLPWREIFAANPNLQNSAEPYCIPNSSSYSDPAIAGGGQIYSQISHVAAHLGFLIGKAPVRLFAQFDNAGTAVDVYNTISLRLEDGCLVSIASTGATPHSERNYELRLYGTKGLLLMELWKGTMELHLFSGETTRYPDLAESRIYPMFAPTTNFVDVILGRAENGSPATLGYYAMRIIDAACHSARSGGAVTLREP